MMNNDTAVPSTQDDDRDRHHPPDQEEEEEEEEARRRDYLAYMYFNAPTARRRFGIPDDVPDAVDELKCRMGRLHDAWRTGDGWRGLLREEAEEAEGGDGAGGDDEDDDDDRCDGPDADDGCDPRRRRRRWGREPEPRCTQSDILNLLRRALLVKTVTRKMLDRVDDLPSDDDEVSSRRCDGLISSYCREAVLEVDVNVRRAGTVRRWFDEFHFAGGYFRHPRRADPGHERPPSPSTARGRKRRLAGAGDPSDAPEEDGGGGQSLEPAAAGGGDETASQSQAELSGDAASPAEHRPASRRRRAAPPSSGGSKRKRAYTPAAEKHISKNFLAMLELLKQYKARHGDCNVPASYRENPTLRRWVNTIRSHERHREKSTFKYHGEEKMALLNHVGFQWVAPSRVAHRPKRPNVSWDERMRDLEAYRVEHGDLLVPSTHPTLGLWVLEVRAARKRQLGGEPSKARVDLTPERVRRLDELGFVWALTKEHWKIKRKRQDAIRTSWEERFGQLERYQGQHGHCRVGAADNPLFGIVGGKDALEGEGPQGGGAGFRYD